jgi:hypothetical protein
MNSFARAPMSSQDSKDREGKQSWEIVSAMVSIASHVRRVGETLTSKTLYQLYHRRQFR